MENKELLSDIFQLERKLFMKMDSYRLIEQKCNQKCLNPDEKKRLYVDIHYVFKTLIRIITNACTSLTEEDIAFCCLKQTGLENMVAGRSMGIASRPAVNQRKYRIKKKMNASKRNDLFDMIFTPAE